MKHHVLLLRRLLPAYPSHYWQIHLDDEDLSGDYLLWEAMNIRSVGPVLHLAPHAGTKDGLLDFVCAREIDRPILMDHFDARLAGKKSKFPLPTRRFSHLRVVWEGSALHLDDKIRPRRKKKEEAPGEIDISVRPSALVIFQSRR